MRVLGQDWKSRGVHACVQNTMESIETALHVCYLYGRQVVVMVRAAIHVYNLPYRLQPSKDLQERERRKV